MKKRFSVNLIYAISMLTVALVRILMSSGVFSDLDYIGRDVVWTVLVQVFAMGVLPVSLYLIYLKTNGVRKPLKTMARDFGYNVLPSAKSWLLILILSVVSTFIISCVSNVWYTFITAIGYRPSISSPQTSYSVGLLFYEIAFTAMLPAFFEELTNRGLLYHGNKGGKRPLKVIALTALMFALMHTNITQVGYTFVFGLIAGALIYATKSIWPAVAYHFINNFTAVVRDYLSANGKGLTFWDTAYDWLAGTVGGGIVSAVLFIAALIFVLWLLMRIGVLETERRQSLPESKRKAYVSADGGQICAEAAVKSRWDNIPLYFAITLNVLITVFTLVWGIIR